MTEIIPGIHQLQIPTPFPSPEYTNVYLIKGDAGYLIIDTGWNTNEAFDTLAQKLKEINISFTDISQIVITHIHPDHYGLTGKIKQLSKATLALHHLDMDLIHTRYVDMDGLLKQTASWLSINGVPENELHDLQVASVGLARFVATAPPDVILHGGETISTGVFSLKVFLSPGHSPGHICLYEPDKKILFSGDHILPNITPHIGLHPQSGNNPLGDYINSLNELKQLDTELILPAHEISFSGLKQRIDNIIQHHHQRNSNILAKIKGKPISAYQTAKGITWLSDKDGAGWQKLQKWEKRSAILETLSHLEFMRFEGKVDKFSKDGIIYYHQS